MCRGFRTRKEWQYRVLPVNLPIVAVEPGATRGWRRYAGRRGIVVGFDRFGESAPEKHCLRISASRSSALLTRCAPSSDTLMTYRFGGISSRADHAARFNASTPRSRRRTTATDQGDPGYGVPAEEIHEGTSHGVRKFNIDTDIRLATMAAIRRTMTKNVLERSAQFPAGGRGRDEKNSASSG
jgi:Transketolase-like TK C-terminal domain/Fructose-bisphosphate aldolase class-II